MKNFFKFTLCIILAVILTFCFITYTDFAIKKDGYGGNDKFIEIKENEICLCFFGKIYKANTEKIQDIIAETKIRQLKAYC